MIAANASEAFANAAAAMVGPRDVVGTVTGLLEDCGALTGAAALGILVHDGQDRLELLSATSHTAAELELYQIQTDTGPCVDTLSTGQQLHVIGSDQIIQRWGEIGKAIAAAGFAQIHTSPLRWHGNVIGGLSAFHRTTEPLDDSALHLSQAFADVAAVVILHSMDVGEIEIADRINDALQGRIVIEQAKGVLAERHDVDMAQAYQLLNSMPRDTGETLTTIATRIIHQAEQPH
ncbi:ANTAR domain-containing protein [Kribbella pittospori]|uniref:ANTAR domain-containing protein n=1 Tax=Kribbella pittospori TaxID=722689 RepID=A0A4R0JF31_9ACTN|nr:GAF and ANTAR domain-containing protein [Kribbella pittospori]TCC45563.1 ANTAR domain-containing protein [Kribbella pittospori]